MSNPISEKGSVFLVSNENYIWKNQNRKTEKEVVFLVSKHFLFAFFLSFYLDIGLQRRYLSLKHRPNTLKMETTAFWSGEMFLSSCSYRRKRNSPIEPDPLTRFIYGYFDPLIRWTYDPIHLIKWEAEFTLICHIRTPFDPLSTVVFYSNYFQKFNVK